MRIENELKKSVKLFPQNIAITDTKKSVSYSLLWKRAELIAAIIQNHDVYIENMLIPVYMGKSILCVEVFLGILISGCGYVPIDTKMPEFQLKQIFEENNFRIAFYDNKKPGFRNNCTWYDAKKVCDHSIKNQLKLKKESSGSDVAYVLYTSGTTGRPKGIKISHNAALEFIIWAKQTLSIGLTDIVASHAPFTFDLSVFDIYATLLCGAKLVLLPTAVSAFPKSLRKIILEQEISVWYSVPSIIMKLEDLGYDDTFSSLRVMIYAGESMPEKYVNKINSEYKFTIYNFYGPTETNVITYFPIKKDVIYNGPIPIGYACPYADIELDPVSNKDQIGELCVRSGTLMIGYQGQDRMLPTEKYHTGDVVKKLNNDCYEFIGRVDNLVKVNGFRVELEEIEAMLCNYSRIQDAVAIYKKGENGSDDYIEAFYVSKEIISEQEIYIYLSKTLQRFKIPQKMYRVNNILYSNRGKKIRDHDKYSGMFEASKEGFV